MVGTLSCLHCGLNVFLFTQTVTEVSDISFVNLNKKEGS